jgi:hypothetical protein
LSESQVSPRDHPPELFPFFHGSGNLNLKPETNIQYPISNTEYPNKSRKPSRPVSPKLAKKAVLAKPPFSRQEFPITNREQPKSE